MKMRVVVSLAVMMALGAAGAAAAQDGGQQQSQSGGGGWQGRGQGQGGWQRGTGGRGTMGTVTEVAADHYTIKTENGDLYTVHFSPNTRIMKMPAGGREQNQGQGQDQGQDQGRGGERPMPQAIKPADIKVGDAVMASGEVDAQAKTIGAVFVLQLDPERARQMQQMQANYGKTWLAGKVTAINGTSVTIEGAMDKTAHTFSADENTTFRKRRDPITMADIAVGDNVRVEGEVKDGTFLATTVSVMPSRSGEGPRGAGAPPPQPPPQP